MGQEQECYPRYVMRFCPRCASEEFQFRQDHSFLCGKCGFEFFTNAAAAVIALIEDREGRLLMVRRGREPGKGKLDLPGGFADPGETAEQALIREVHEELNLEVERCSYYCSHPNTYLYGGIVYFTLDLAFSCTVRDLSVIREGDDAGSYLFLHQDEIPMGEIAFDSIRQVARRYVSSRVKGQGQG